VSIPQVLEIALRGEEVPEPLLETVFGEIAEGRATPAQIAALLIALRAKGETANELVAVARALRARALCAPLPIANTVDTCGTGGDATGTFNISTAAAFVTAGAGVPVAKHGNRAASSRSGSMDVLEALGVRVEISVERAARLLREVGFAPLFARVAHPAMRHVAPVRAELGVRTLMNCIGPLLHPLGVRRQVVGVYSADWVERFARALGALGGELALVVHGDDGLDELTTTALTQAVFLAEGKLTRLTIDARDFGFPRAQRQDLSGGDPEENAVIIRTVLKGEAGPRRDVVLLNAAAALWIGGAARDLAEGVTLAAASVDSGKALRCLEAVVRATAEAE